MKKIKTILSWHVAESAVQEHDPVGSVGRVLPFLSEIRTADREHLVVLVLNARSVVLAVETVSIGTLSASLVHPREVFKAAIMFNGAAIIVAHNHPSGVVDPSSEDKECTRRLKDAGKLLGIPLLDHVIVGSVKHFSFKEGGLL